MSNVSIDLIYAVPFQSLETWLETLRRAIALRPDHVSTYCLSFEEGTLLFRRRAEGRVPEVEADLQWDQLDAACGELEAAGYRRYEVSNWARARLRVPTQPGVLALPPGVRSGRRARTHTPPTATAPGGGGTWPDRASTWPRRGRPRADGEELESRQAIAESLMLGLRTAEGMAAPRGFDAELGRLQQAGLIRRINGRIVPTRRGMDLHNQIALAVL